MYDISGNAPPRRSLCWTDGDLFEQNSLRLEGLKSDGYFPDFIQTRLLEEVSYETKNPIMTTSGADEIFFILKTCLSRALKSGTKPIKNQLCSAMIIQSNESTLILGACRVVKSTFEIIVDFLKEKVRICLEGLSCQEIEFSRVTGTSYVFNIGKNRNISGEWI